uniref:Uncharacterized protein n=1 Tax=Arundo donax TaxID=35708 RepID=A0A0A8Z2X6_ARUDO
MFVKLYNYYHVQQHQKKIIDPL